MIRIFLSSSIQSLGNNLFHTSLVFAVNSITAVEGVGFCGTCEGLSPVEHN